MKNLAYLLFAALACCFNLQSYSQNGIHFDGSNDYIQTSFNGVHGTTNRTFEAWVKVDVGAPSSNLCIVDYGVNAVGSRNTFSVTGSRGITFISGGTNANISSTPGVVTAGQWTHVAFVLNNGVGYLYVNGTQVGTGSLTTVNTPSTGIQNLKIGERVTGGTIPFEGVIDEVRIWNVARTQTEISNNRNAEFCSVPANLVAYYTFNQGNAGSSNTGLTNLHNAVLNANGTLNNFSLSGSTSNWVTGASLTPGLTVSKNNEEVCDSLVSPSGLYTWTTSGGYYDTVPNANSCDSIIRIGLVVNNSVYEVVNDTSCDPYQSPSGNYTFTTSGQYFDTTLTSKGCNHIYELNLIVNVNDTTISVFGSNLTANESNAAYEWLDCANNYAPISGATSQSFTVPSNGSYAVRLDKEGCVDTSACVEVSWQGINEVNNEEISIYPNPSSGEFNITSTTPINQITLHSSLGELVYQKNLNEQDISHFSTILFLLDGLYYMSIQTNSGIETKKLFLKRE
jgi:hypothetical protein